MANEQQSSRVFRLSSLVLALGFLGFLMVRAGGLGCSKPSAPIGAESPPGNTVPARPTPTPASPPAAPASAPAPEATAAAAPSVEPAATPSAQTPSAAKPSGKPAGPPPGYFPGTKAAPMPWANENPPAQAPQQQAPKK